MKMRGILIAVVIAVFTGLLAANGIAASAFDTNSGQPSEYNNNNNMPGMGEMTPPPEAFHKKPIPKEGMTLFNLPWNVPWGGIFLTAFLIAFPFLLIIGIAIYRTIFKKGPAQNQ